MIYISLHSMHFYFFPGASHTSCRGIFNSKPEIGNANASTKWSMLPADCTGKPLYSGLIPKKSLDATEPSQKKNSFLLTSTCEWIINVLWLTAPTHDVDLTWRICQPNFDIFAGSSTTESRSAAPKDTSHQSLCSMRLLVLASISITLRSGRW